MPSPRANAALIACCVTLLALPAVAQTGANTDTSPAATPAPVAVPDAAPPAVRPREAGPVVPMQVWRDPDGKVGPVQGSGLSAPERMAAGRPATPMPPGSRPGGVPGMNAGASPQPLPAGSIVNTAPRMMAGKSPTVLPEGATPGDAPGMQAGPAPQPLPFGSTPSAEVAKGG